MRLSSSSVVLLFTSAWACQGRAIERPEGGVMHAQNGGSVYAEFEDIGLAARAGLVIDAYYDLVSERLGESRGKPVEVWLSHDYDGQAHTNSERVVFNPEYAAYLAPFLAHEFVHWHIGESLLQSNLPHGVIEGLCESISLELVPEHRDLRRDIHKELLAQYRSQGAFERLIPTLGYEYRSWRKLPEQDKYSTYAIGCALVDRIGTDVLLAAARESKLLLSDVLRMAGVQPDGSGL